MSLPILDSLETSLADVLDQKIPDPRIRSHLQRALAHVREAAIGVRHPGCCRSADQLARDHAGFNLGSVIAQRRPPKRT